MTATRKRKPKRRIVPAPDVLAVYDNDRIGTLLDYRNGRVEVRDLANRLLGTFATRIEAMRALGPVHNIVRNVRKKRRAAKRENARELRDLTPI
jgi:hypothetical protein